jgi:hypothetical protein
LIYVPFKTFEYLGYRLEFSERGVRCLGPVVEEKVERPTGEKLEAVIQKAIADYKAKNPGS